MSERHVSPLSIQNGFAYGWAQLQGQQTREVHLFMDGAHVATERTGVPLPAGCESACGPMPAGAAGFAFALPAAALDGFEHALHAAVTAGAADGIHGPSRTYEHSRVRGQVEQGPRQFVGTVWFKDRPAGQPEVLVACASGEVVHRHPLLVSQTCEARGYAAPFAIACNALPAGGALTFTCAGQALKGSPLQRRPTILGVVEQLGAGRIAGWAFDGSHPGQPLELCLRVDGRPYSWFRPNMRRPELEAQLGEIGLVGFALPLPEGVDDGCEHRIEVVSAHDGALLTDGHRLLRLEPPGLACDTAGQPAPVAACPPDWPAPQVSVIVLNRNGERVLASFLESWARFNRTVAAEIIVIDHASTDASLALLRQWQQRLDLTVVPLEVNDSFSASCNRGARMARGQTLLFMNNDIVWLQDALPAMLESLRDPQVGIVGLKLLKAVGESSHALLPATEVQHLGVRFKLNRVGYWPYEVAPSPLREEPEYSPQVMPVVTGAVLLCRRADFEAVGGFHEDYFYGFEDVELCLRLSQRLAKLVVCRNDLVALHRHGHTRLSGRELSLFDRVQRNADVLQRHVGLWAKQAYWRSLLQGDRYMTSEPLSVGIVVDAEPSGSGGNTELVDAARTLAGQVRAQFPHARVVLLPPTRGWKRVAGLHVLVVGTPAYDVRSLEGARSDLLTVAWVRREPQAWRASACWGDFDGYLAANPALAAQCQEVDMQVCGRGGAVGELLSTKRWRLRTAIHVPLAAGELAGASPVARRAQRLRQALKAQGLPCWLVPQEAWEEEGRMADVLVLVQDGSDKPSGRTDTLNVPWWTEDGGRWSGSAGSASTWLHEHMEAAVGSTFRPS